VTNAGLISARFQLAVAKTLLTNLSQMSTIDEGQGGREVVFHPLVAGKQAYHRVGRDLIDYHEL